MAFEEKDPLSEQSTSYLRTLLSSEIQDFIRSLELKSSIDELTSIRDRIRHLYAVLSPKENVEFDQIVGKYFYTFIGEHPDDSRLAKGI